MFPLFDTDRSPGLTSGRPFSQLLRAVPLCAALVLPCTAIANPADPPGRPEPQTCPQPELPTDSRCYSGRDANGSWYWIAIPAKWTGTLVVHSHGGPSLETPKQDSPLADLKRFSVVLREGHAWVGSSYRKPGFGVTSAAEDTDEARRIFWQFFGKPARTLLHGQSWGAGVAVKTAEIHPGTYDGIVLTSGVLGGGTGSYDFRADLRAVYQFYCGNHPSAGDLPYLLWQGLAARSVMTVRQLTGRISECTGIDVPAGQRSPQQRQRLQNILAVTGIPERALVSHMTWATFTFRDLVQRHLQGGNPFGNTEVIYSGSDDDAALNRGITRFASNPEAVERLSADADLTGKLEVPTLSLHAIDDPTAFVELESSFRTKVLGAGSEGNLLQIFTDEDQHQKLSNSEYAAAFRAVSHWLRTRRRPDTHRYIALCQEAARRYDEPCKVAPDFIPRALSTRVAARNPQRPVLTLDSGVVRGVSNGEVERFLGLPFAAPPTGARRWRRPEPSLSWTGVQDASTFASRCPQSEQGLESGVESEDCLYLNIFRPARAPSGARPIYVYLHGGGATAGSGNDHDGSALANEGDIIVVTLNYRLGALGFLNSDSIAHETTGGNYGVDDAREALQWVARNAAALGGDANKITVGGQSAGGTLVCQLLTDTSRLFSRVIISSDDCLHDVDDLATARQRANSVLQRVGCTGEAHIEECSRSKSALDLVRAGGFAAPTVESKLAFTLASEGQLKGVPMLVGANRQEGRSAGPSFVHFGQRELDGWLQALIPGERLAEVRHLYLGRYASEPDPIPYIVSDIITDSGMRGLGGCTSLRFAQAASSKEHIFYYEFADPSPPHRASDSTFKSGSAHGTELQYLWPSARNTGNGALTTQQQALAREMRRYWSNFIRTGSPNDGLPVPVRWPDLRRSRYLLLQPDPSVRVAPVQDFIRFHECQLWSGMPWIMSRGEAQP